LLVVKVGVLKCMAIKRLRYSETVYSTVWVLLPSTERKNA